MKNSITLATLMTLLAFGPTASFGDDKAKDSKAASNSKAYPLKACVVSDEKLGNHGKPYVFKHEGEEVQLCCKGCLKDFKKDSAKYVKKITEARKKS